MQIMEGDLTRRLEAAAARIAHIQIADNPGRHEPGAGEINFPFLFALIDRIGHRAGPAANTGLNRRSRQDSAG
jgi:hydroxypyruvate isomerase